MSMFREYDIRGIVGDDLTNEMVTKIGKAIGSRAQGTILVGRDNRTHSEKIQSLFTKALLSTGCNVINLNIITSPMLYFASQTYPNNASIIITASHNPKEYNGFKMIIKGKGVYGKEIQKLKKEIKKENFKKGKGKLQKLNIKKTYTDSIKKKFKFSKKLNVVVDCGNGTTSFFNPKVLEDLGCNVTKLYCESDGNFPNHEPDPVVEKNMQELSAKVKEIKADIGIGFDGDGDRMGIVDENGILIPGDKILIILARDVLKNNKGAKIIYEVKCSQTLEEDIKKQGGIPIMYKTGHSLIKAKMQEEKAILAGEMSGHFFFQELNYFDDALYAACKVLDILGKSNKKVSKLLNGVPKTYATPEIREECPDSIKKAVIKELQERFKKYHPLTIDGVRINFKDGWGLVRASNTQPALVIRCEAKTPQRLKEIKKLIEDEVKNVKSKA